MERSAAAMPRPLTPEQEARFLAWAQQRERLILQLRNASIGYTSAAWTAASTAAVSPPGGTRSARCRRKSASDSGTPGQTSRPAAYIDASTSSRPGRSAGPRACGLRGCAKWRARLGTRAVLVTTCPLLSTGFARRVARTPCLSGQLERPEVARCVTATCIPGLGFRRRLDFSVRMNPPARTLLSRLPIDT
jgi:hypothetical protein